MYVHVLHESQIAVTQQLVFMVAKLQWQMSPFSNGDHGASHGKVES